MKMKILFSVVVIVPLVAAMGAPSTFALTQFQSGYNHGLTDGKHSCIHPGADQDKCYEYHDYVSHPGKGFINQTKEFIDGYVLGFCRGL
jgi:hypothetical protein